MSFDLTQLRCMTLSQAESAWQAGDVSDADFEAFLTDWNSTPGRLRRFETRDRRLRQVWERDGETPIDSDGPPEAHWAGYRADPSAEDSP